MHYFWSIYGYFLCSSHVMCACMGTHRYFFVLSAEYSCSLGKAILEKCALLSISVLAQTPMICSDIVLALFWHVTYLSYTYLIIGLSIFDNSAVLRVVFCLFNSPCGPQKNMYCSFKREIKTQFEIHKKMSVLCLFG